MNIAVFKNLPVAAVTAGQIFGKIGSILIILIGILFVIVIHELGHFIFAKLSGIKVNEFAIGMGPKIFSRQRGETKYSLRAIPIGGFCAMEGEDEENDDPRAFGNAKVRKRIITIAGGALFNIILGFLFAIIICAPQKGFYIPVVDGFVSQTAGTYQSGLREGDKIIKVNGRRIYAISDLSYILDTDDDAVYEMVVKRGGSKLTLDKVAYNTLPSEEDGKVRREGEINLKAEKNSFLVTIKQGFLTTVSYGRIVWMSLIDIISGKFGISEVSGPVGMISAGSEIVSRGFFDTMAFLCLITVNLGIFNLLPIPGLDGARLIFLLIEAVRRKPVPPKYEGVVHAVGLILLFGFMIVITFKDIVQIFL